MFPHFIFGCWSRVLVFTASLVVLPKEGAGLGGVCIVRVGVVGDLLIPLLPFVHPQPSAGIGRLYGGGGFGFFQIRVGGNFGMWGGPGSGCHARVEIWQQRFWFKSAGKLLQRNGRWLLVRVFVRKLEPGLQRYERGCLQNTWEIRNSLLGYQVELNGAVWVCHGYALGGVVGESYG
ncbi:uncharacterized protein EI90DRAFT_3023411 [Cantharellus anzutake]|uniref:uncharacterized protein n=1 Tax=Cantharellus anzutake TaxID=1750568 RepID=UPI00190593F1|nr:uncharacterized protein EI90DRAFT_3023411 [Cantharellus anzutake]KAF8311782.1 hypothetical protein EI90DRAFT_3023411 [Cantharellus anzutake]